MVSSIGANSTEKQQVSLTQDILKRRLYVDLVLSFVDGEKENQYELKTYKYNDGINNDISYYPSNDQLRISVSYDIRKKKNQRLVMILSLGAKSLDDNRYKDYSESYQKAISLINNHRGKIKDDFECKQEIHINPCKKVFVEKVKQVVHNAIQEQEKNTANDIADIYDYFWGKSERLGELDKALIKLASYSLTEEIHVHIETILPFFSFAFEFKKQCEEQNIAIIDSIDVLYKNEKSIEFELERCILTDIYTEGHLYIKGQYDNNNSYLLCDTLEDKDRGLKNEYYGNIDSDTSYAINKAIKIHGETAIPRGTYTLGNEDSYTFGNKLSSYPTYQEVYELNSWKGKMPNIIFNKPSNSESLYSKVLFHWGRTIKNTEGCILLGKKEKDGQLTNYDDSLKYWVAFMNIFQPALDNEYNLSLSISIKKEAEVLTSVDTNEISMYCNENDSNCDESINNLITAINNNSPQQEIAEYFQRVISSEKYKNNEQLQIQLKSIFGNVINYQDSISG